jgi:hypothetical protein
MAVRWELGATDAAPAFGSKFLLRREILVCRGAAFSDLSRRAADQSDGDNVFNTSGTIYFCRVSFFGEATPCSHTIRRSADVPNVAAAWN